jgi:uncharacterized protein YdhG (YjbR/CyaY superfamily)
VKRQARCLWISGILLQRREYSLGQRSTEPAWKAAQAAVSIRYYAIVANELPSELKKGQIFKLSGVRSLSFWTGRPQRSQAPVGRNVRRLNMEKSVSPPKNIDEYIVGFPEGVQVILRKVRDTIRDVAGDAEEAIKYGVPTFVLNRANLVHFGAFQKHVGFYPTPSGIEKFKTELSAYERAKGSVRFPLNKPIPYVLIGEIVSFRVKEVIDKAADKKAVSDLLPFI